MNDKIMDRCGLFGLYNNDNFDTSRIVYYGLFSLQHRGVEAAGICVNNGTKFQYKKDAGLVIDVFDETALEKLQGHMGIGHVLRYPGQDAVENAQPIVIRYTKGQMAVALNGNLTNVEELRKELELQGAVFQTMEAAEVISVLISRSRNKFKTIEEAIADVMPRLKGGYALLVMTPRKIIGVRDPLGIRPLALGKKQNSWFLSSETCAFNELDVDFEREVCPGEIVIINKDGVSSKMTENVPEKGALCMFEYVYHSRPDSVLGGIEVFKARYNMGKELAAIDPVDADAVVWIPDSGLAAAKGYAETRRLPLADAFLKNRYYCNKLVMPDAEMFARGINMKLSAIKSQVEGKRVIVVDDSMFNGTTAGIFVAALKTAGAKEVHLRIASPQVKYLCLYGASTPDRKTPSAANCTAADICQKTGADSVAFMTLEAMERACKGTQTGFCTACFNGDYPVK